jgi:hypothetical protein
LLAKVGNDRTRHKRWDHHGSSIDEAELSALIEQAAPFLAAGDGPNALMILVPVAQALAESWADYAEWDETLHEFFPPLDRMIAQAVLMDGISSEVREELADRVSDWQDQVAEYGAEDAFAIATSAATLGWNEPGLDDVLSGRITDWPAGKGSDGFAKGLVEVRLGALEAMGRTSEYLNLAKATGRVGDTCVMLVKCGRGKEAIALAHANLHEPGAVHRLVLALSDTSERDDAFDLAGRAIAFPPERSSSGDRYALACWLRAEAGSTDRIDLAVLAARVAFTERLTRDDYGAARRLCDQSAWPQFRAELLHDLIGAAYAPDRVDILLDEGMIDEAICVVDRSVERNRSPFDTALKRLAEAACRTRGDWVIDLCMSVASPIMDEGRSSHYDVAAQWLNVAGRAHAETGRWNEWIATLDRLIETHRRKHKLRGALAGLRGKR